ncbi:MAG: hypothetical protein LV479_03550 [Methylacidiphilales bacterium]|nr:hypothetical protein [Candidatus Methylacidiphilales bacterium]
MANRFVSVPREALADLLKVSGSTLTPEQYLASITESDIYNRYPSRVRASVWSRNILLIAALVSGFWVCLPMGFSIEGIIVAIGLGFVTFFEYRVHRYFCDLDPRAPSLGFRNQSCFAAGILIYGLYHAWWPSQISMPEFNNVMDPDTMEFIHKTIQIAFLVVGMVGGISQFGLAWYYRTARISN